MVLVLHKSIRSGRVDTGGQAPLPIIIPALLGLVALLVFPLVALVSRASWDTLWEDITSQTALQALGLSLLSALFATLLCVICGVPLAILIARSNARTAALLRTLVAVPTRFATDGWRRGSSLSLR